jgi:Flp pilus assembly protein TadG
MLRRLKRRGADERGVVLVLVAMFMVSFLGMAALAIDIGSFYQSQRQAQAAADAGALAAAQDLPGGAAAATTDGKAYALKNYPTASTPTVSTPYNGNSSQVKVTVDATTPSFFGHIFGLTSQHVTASAVASLTSSYTPCASAGSQCYAIFAMDTSCSTSNPPVAFGLAPLSPTGGGTHITGGVHSNGSMNVGGGGSSFGPTTYGNGSGCTMLPSNWNITGNTFTSGPTAEAPILTYPINYANDFPACSGGACTGPGGTPSFCTSATTATSETLQTYTPANMFSGNIYCDVGSGTASTPTTWNGTITVQGGPVESTFVAGKVIINGGSSITACGYATSGYTVSGCSAAVPVPTTGNYPMIYAVGAGTPIDDSAGGNFFSGDMFAPNGTVNIGGGSWTVFVEAKDIYAPAGGFTGDGPQISGGGSGTTGTTALVQ